MTLAFVESIPFLLGNSPFLVALAVLTFGAIGYWYGYVSWYVSTRRMRVLESEYERLEATVEKLKDRIGVEKASTLHSPHRSVPDFDDFTALPGVDNFACARLHQTGIQYFSQLAELEELTKVELEKFRLSFGIGRFRLEEWRWAWGGEESLAIAEETHPSGLGDLPGTVRDEELGLIFLESPDSFDELTLIEGLGPKQEGALYDLGIYRFRQIAGWGEVTVDVLESKLNLGLGYCAKHAWRSQARRLACWSDGLRQETFIAPSRHSLPKIIDHEFSGEKGLRVDDELGIVFDFQPEISDDLTEVPGIEPEIAQRLTGLGIYRWRQIAYWTDAHLTVIANLLEVEKEHIDTGKWIPHAGMLDRQRYAASRVWQTARPSIPEISAVIGEHFPSEAVSPNEDLGITYLDEPTHSDPLEDLPGIDAHMEFALNSVGVWCFKQISLWSGAHVEAHAERLSINPETILHLGWIRSAAQLACRPAEAPQNHRYALSSRDLLNQGARLDQDLGLVFHREPFKIDNLKLVKGIGPKLEGRLRELGIYQYQQFALWTPENVAEVSKRLQGVGNRILNNHWQEQAGELIRQEQILVQPARSTDPDEVSLTT